MSDTQFNKLFKKIDLVDDLIKCNYYHDDYIKIICHKDDIKTLENCINYLIILRLKDDSYDYPQKIFDNIKTRYLLYKHFDKFFLSNVLTYELFLNLIHYGDDEQITNILFYITPFLNIMYFYKVEYKRFEKIIEDIYNQNPNNRIIIEFTKKCIMYMYDSNKFSISDINMLLKTFASSSNINKYEFILENDKFRHEYIYSLCENLCDNKIQCLLKKNYFDDFNLTYNLLQQLLSNEHILIPKIIFMTFDYKKIHNVISYSKIKFLYNYDKLKICKNDLHTELKQHTIFNTH